MGGLITVRRRRANEEELAGVGDHKFFSQRVILTGKQKRGEKIVRENFVRPINLIIVVLDHLKVIQGRCKQDINN